jgi:hypothetical protein
LSPPNFNPQTTNAQVDQSAENQGDIYQQKLKLIKQQMLNAQGYQQKTTGQFA